jgi:ferredoxin-NADP reductase
MEQHPVKILNTHNVTHDVKRFKLTKPEKYSFAPGQATEVSINKPGWIDEKRPFTFTNLPADEYLEMIIKKYPSHNGVTNQLHKLK